MKNYGFLPDSVAPDHYMFGSKQLPLDPIQPDGNWKHFIPSFEPQNRKFETYNCTSFATLNCLEILTKRKFGSTTDYSDRFLGILAGTSSAGNSPHVVAETLRKCGLVPDFRLPFSDDLQTIDEYYSLKGANEEELTNIAEDWLKNWSFGHDWVFNPESLPSKEERQKLMMTALMSSPLGVAVQAWPGKNDKGIYISNPTQSPNHWTACIVGFKENEYWEVFDSYIEDGEPFKKLAWDYDFTFVKRYTIEKKDVPKVEGWFVKLINLFKSLWATVQNTLLK